MFLRQNRSCSASDSAYSYTFLHSIVCLSVVCHIHAPCLNRFRCHLAGTPVWSSDTLCYMWVRDPAGEGEIWGLNPQSEHAVANCHFHGLTR